MAKKQKFYVVWVGQKPGVYTDWATTARQVNGFPGARYKSFPSRAQAEAAFQAGAQTYGTPVASAGKHSRPRKKLPTTARPLARSISVDAACSGNPGPMEYQGVTTVGAERLFHQAFPLGTNNIGEFLALVHALAFLKKQAQTELPIYSDSRIAIGWVYKGKAKTTLKRDSRTEQLFEYLDRAEAWLANNKITNPIYKWETEKWGEIPADFGRK